MDANQCSKVYDLMVEELASHIVSSYTDPRTHRLRAPLEVLEMIRYYKTPEVKEDITYKCTGIEEQEIAAGMPVDGCAAGYVSFINDMWDAWTTKAQTFKVVYELTVPEERYNMRNRVISECRA